MRRTVASLIPISAAIVRVLQWVALAGLDCVVLRINSSLRLAEMAGLRPGRGASFSRPGQIELQKPFPPARGLLVAEVQGGGDFQIGLAPGSQENDLGTLHLPSRKRTRSGPLLQGFPLGWIDDNRRGNAHRTPP